MLKCASPFLICMPKRPVYVTINDVKYIHVITEDVCALSYLPVNEIVDCCIETSQELASLQTKVNTLINQLTAQQAQITNLSTVQSTHTSQISNLQTSVSTQLALLNNLQTTISTVQDDLSNLTTTVNLHSLNITGIQTDLTNLSNLYTALNNQVILNTSAITTIQNNVSNLILDLTNLTNQVNTNTTDISVLQNNQVTIQTTLNTLQTSVSNLLNDLLALQTTVTNIQTSISAIQSNLTTLNTLVTTLQNDLNSLTATVTNIQLEQVTQNNRLDAIEDKLLILDDNCVFRPHRVATGGLGTYLNPWVGWDALLNAQPISTHVDWCAGHFQAAGQLNIKRGQEWLGKGKEATQIHAAGVGDFIVGNHSINSSVRAANKISNLTLDGYKLGNVTGFGYLDLGGTYTVLEHLIINGFKDCVVFDQTELAAVDTVQCEGAARYGIWLCNNDRDPAYNGGFTNVITVEKCQLNGCQVGINDSGGQTHMFINNNFNGSYQHDIFASGVINLQVDGGNFEGCLGNNIHLDFRTHVSGLTQGIGGNLATSFRGMLVSQTAGNHTYRVVSAQRVICIGNFYTGTSDVAHIDGGGFEVKVLGDFWYNPQFAPAGYFVQL